MRFASRQTIRYRRQISRFASPRLRVALIIALITSLWAPSALAHPWLKLDRVEAEPSWFEGIARVRVYVSAVTLEGGTIPVAGKKQWTLQLGSSKKKLPYLAGHFKAVDDEIAVALVIETAEAFSGVLAQIKSGTSDFIEALPSGSQVGVIAYGEDIEGARRISTAKKALRTIEDLDADSLPSSEVLLIKAINRAVRMLKRAKPSTPGTPMRRMIIVISDGRDVDPEPDNYRGVAKRADRAQIRIHSLAYSPDDKRRPMLGLGELSKRSQGTFRLVRSKVSFEPNFLQLREEIERQYVLTYYVPIEQVTGKRFKILAKELVSNELRVKKVRCGADSCSPGHFCASGKCVAHPTSSGRGIIGWILIIAGALVGLLVLLMLLGFLLGRRERKRAGAAALAQAAASAQGAATAAPEHRIVGQGPGGHAQPQPAAGGRVTGHAPGHNQGAAAHHPAAPALAPTLYILQGPRQGQRLPLRHGFTIGKAPDCDFVLEGDSFASSHHARIHMDAAQRCSLVDLRSTNGTFVNGVRAMEEKRLLGGEAIRVGSMEMRFLQQ